MATPIKLVKIKIFKSHGSEPQACEAHDSIPLFEAKFLDPSAGVLRVNSSMPIESLKTIITKTTMSLKIDSRNTCEVHRKQRTFKGVKGRVMDDGS